jgi:tRNA(Ser,Leu) C12 N-acetylase TAN1
VRTRVREVKPDWNVVVMTGTGLVMKAINDLRARFAFAELRASPHGGVAIGKLRSDGDLIDLLNREHADHPEAFRHVQRMVPVERVLPFVREDVTETLCEALADQAYRVAGKRFYVRCRLRGLESRLEARAVERAIGSYLVELALLAGPPPKVAFDDAEIVVGLEVIGTTVGYAFHDHRAIGSALVRPR